MAYSEDSVKRMIDVLPSHYSLGRYVLVVVEAMRGRNEPIAFDKQKVIDFVRYCAQTWNETRAETHFIGLEELWEIINDLEDYEAKQRDRMSTIPP